MMCVDANQDGKVDFNEFTDRFHNPAKDIGFNVAVLLTNLSEHMPNDPRYTSQILSSKMMKKKRDCYEEIPKQKNSNKCIDYTSASSLLFWF